MFYYSIILEKSCKRIIYNGFLNFLVDMRFSIKYSKTSLQRLYFLHLQLNLILPYVLKTQS